MKFADFGEYIYKYIFQTADWLPPIYPKVSFELRKNICFKKTYTIMDQFRCFPISTNYSQASIFSLQIFILWYIIDISRRFLGLIIMGIFFPQEWYYICTYVFICYIISSITDQRVRHIYVRIPTRSNKKLLEQNMKSLYIK